MNFKRTELKSKILLNFFIHGSYYVTLYTLLKRAKIPFILFFREKWLSLFAKPHIIPISNTYFYFNINSNCQLRYIDTAFDYFWLCNSNGPCYHTDEMKEQNHLLRFLQLSVSVFRW